MRKIVLYCLTCLLFSACIRDNMDDCGAVARFIFTYEHSVEDFDRIVGNDVHVQIFRDDRLLETDIVPYETIKGGQEYVITNYESGSYRVIAWAVPVNTPDVPEIPVLALNEAYSDLSLGMERMPNSTTYYEPIGEIFLGEEPVTLVREEDSRHEISLEPCICKVYFTLYRSHLLMENDSRAATDEVWVELEGSRSEMMADRSCGGEESIVYKALTYLPEEQTLYSDVMGVLPSEEDQTLTVTVYKQGVRICTVETMEKAVAGDVIHIIGILGTDVKVFVNNWEVKNARVTFF